jgi:hypothetical protein
MNNNKLVIPSIFVLIPIIFFSVPSSNFNLIDYVCASSSLSSALECSKKTTDDYNLCFDNCLNLACSLYMSSDLYANSVF